MLKRKISVGNDRSAGDIEVTITLQDELDAITEEYNKAVSLLVPSLDGVTLTDGVTVADGIIYLSEDQTVPQYSIEGIAAAEILLAIANGEDAEAATQRITAEIEGMFGGAAVGEAERGVFLKLGPATAAVPGCRKTESPYR
jgi:hypothetical protein